MPWLTSPSAHPAAWREKAGRWPRAQHRRLAPPAPRHARGERQPDPAQRGAAERTQRQPQAGKPQHQRERVQPQQADQRDDHVDVAFVAAHHAARQAKPRQHDEGHHCQQHPRCPLAGAVQFGLQADAVPSCSARSMIWPRPPVLRDAAVRMAGASSSEPPCSVQRIASVITASGKAGAAGSRSAFAVLVNRVPLPMSADERAHTVRERANYAPGLPRHVTPRGHEKRGRKRPRSGKKQVEVARARSQRRPKNESTATTTTTRPTM
jgi:hypothetical protein